MRISRRFPFLFLGALIFVTVFGCSAVSTGPPENSAAMGGRLSRLLGDTLVAAVRPARVRLDRSKSWIAPDIARRPRKLFISDAATADVYIFSMPDLTLLATIAGFSEPQGMCSDTLGNVWVTDTGATEIVQLSRDGAVIGTLGDPDGYPVGCAVDPATGNLAVANLFNFTNRPFSSGSGEVEIYVGPAHSGPTSLDNPDQYYYDFPAYQRGPSTAAKRGSTIAQSNLFVDGENATGVFMLSELTAGTTAFFTINISGGTIHVPGLVQWYRSGPYLAVGDQECGGVHAACIYQVAISGTTGTITGVTNLSNPGGGQVCDLVQGVIGAHGLRYVAGGDIGGCGTSGPTVDRWAYPAGGTPTNFNSTVVSEPIGAAISAK